MLIWLIGWGIVCGAIWESDDENKFWLLVGAVPAWPIFLGVYLGMALRGRGR